jgi:hypothetical protein
VRKASGVEKKFGRRMESKTETLDELVLTGRGKKRGGDQEGERWTEKYGSD